MYNYVCCETKVLSTPVTLLIGVVETPSKTRVSPTHESFVLPWVIIVFRGHDDYSKGHVYLLRELLWIWHCIWDPFYIENFDTNGVLRKEILDC